MAARVTTAEGFIHYGDAVRPWLRERTIPDLITCFAYCLLGSRTLADVDYVQWPGKNLFGHFRADCRCSKADIKRACTGHALGHLMHTLNGVEGATLSA
jgi:hypothetical protein